MTHRITVSRQNPDHPFGLTRVDWSTEVDDFGDAERAISYMTASLDESFPIRPQTENPLATAPAPAPAPAPVPIASPPADLQGYEAMASPAGDSKGLPLATCTDTDLEWIATQYKKGGPVAVAAAAVLAARRAGLTTRK